MAKATIDVLHVEDDCEDVEFAQLALSEIPGHNMNMISMGDGEEAIKYLNRLEPYASAISPDLILLDLNLPKVSGRDVLKSVKSSPSLRQIPIVILTASTSADDIFECYRWGASGYIPKPVGLEDYKHTFNVLSDYWANLLRVPPKAFNS